MSNEKISAYKIYSAGVNLRGLSHLSTSEKSSLVQLLFDLASEREQSSAVDHARVNVETVREVEADLREWGEAGDVQLLVRANWLAAAIGESP